MKVQLYGSFYPTGVVTMNWEPPAWGSTSDKIDAVRREVIQYLDNRWVDLPTPHGPMTVQTAHIVKFQVAVT